MSSRTALLAVVLGLSLPLTAQQRHVVVNRVALTDEQVREIETRWTVQVRDGRYWYDRVSGAWGMDGGPTAGWILPGLAVGGPLPADASAGNTGVFVNGRELPVADVAALMQVTPVYRGRWWVDAQGNFGAEGGPVLGNLVALARQRTGRATGPWSVYANKGNDFIAGDSNGCTYFNSRDNGTGTSTSWASPGC